MQLALTGFEDCLPLRARMQCVLMAGECVSITELCRRLGVDVAQIALPLEAALRASEIIGEITPTGALYRKGEIR